MKPRLLLAALVATAQLVVLGFMTGQRESVLHYGRSILLRTAPVDPNDPMRGEYARFNYELSSVPRALWRDGLPARFPPNSYDYRSGRDLRVYAALRVDEAGIAELVSLSDRQPADGLYLQGRVNNLNGANLSVRYGIEALFLEQGKSQKLEDARRKERPGAPMDAEVAVSDAGLAVIKGYQWEPLGIVATFERTPPPPQPAPAPGNRPPPRTQPVITALTLELKNYGTEDLAIVDAPDGGSFRLVAANTGQETHYRWVGEARPAGPAPEAAQVFVLKPGESHRTRIDLTRPEWFVVDTRLAPAKQKPLALREVTDLWSASFRMEYAPPPKDRVATLPHAERIRHARLLSRMFNPGTNID
jgi:uncharacterized membrane-anchored protein